MKAAIGGSKPLAAVSDKGSLIMTASGGSKRAFSADARSVGDALGASSEERDVGPDGGSIAAGSLEVILLGCLTTIRAWNTFYGGD